MQGRFSEMKILLYGINFAPELTGIGKYTDEMAAWLAARGHEVRVVTAPPYYPDWKVRADFRNWWTVDDRDGLPRYVRNDGGGRSDGVVDDVGLRNDDGGPQSGGKDGSLLVLRCPLWVPARPGGFKRVLHLASFALCSLPVMLRQVFWRPDVVWVVEPALFCAPAAVAVARLCGAKAWLHVQDFEVDAAFDLGLLRGAFVRRRVAAAERWLMRRFDVVSTISKRMHQRLLDKGVAAAKARMAVNWVNMADFALPCVDGVAAYRRALTLEEGEVVALYSGNMGGKQGLELLADVARLCLISSESNRALEHNQRAPVAIIFVFCGHGAGRADLVARCQGLSNVRFMDLQPAARLPDLLALADIHLLPQRADAADLVMPSKLTGMFASARPVIATAHAGTELASVVHGCGLVVAPEDAPAFAQALQNLARDALLREQLGAAAYLYAQTHLDRAAVLQQFEADLQALTR